MNLLDLAVKIGVEDNASGQMDKIASSTIAKATAMGQAMYDVAKGIAGSAVEGLKAIGQGALEGYSKYEQLSAGAKLAFGDMYDFIDQKSRQSYRTVQMSQNEYLEQVNGLAVGLRESMGGNAEAAAELADKVITAEADVVAAMGITQDEAQNAFNGIMKGNYNMLDNLRLGIKPTKEGMQEVIDKVNDWRKAQGKAGDLTIDSLADCQAAVVDYVEMMGYKGYAEREGLSTIEGSANAAKAAWADLLTGIGAGNGERVQEAVRGLVVSLFGTWDDELGKKTGGLVNNLIPVIQNVASAIGEQLPSIATQLAFQFIEAFSQAFLGLDSTQAGDLVEGLSEKFENAKEKITTIASEIGDGLSGAFASFTDTVDFGYVNVAIEKLGGIAEDVWGFVEQNIIPNLPTIGELLGQVVNFLADVGTTVLTVIDNLGPFIPMILGIIGGLGALSAISGIIGAISGAVTFLTTVLVPAFTMIQSFSGLIAVITTLMGGPITIIFAIIGALVALIATNEDVRNALVNAWETVKQKFAEVVEWASNLGSMILEAVGDLGGLLLDVGASIINGLLDGLRSGWDAVSGFFGELTSMIPEWKGPEQRDKRLLTPSAHMIMGSLVSGLEDEIPEVEKTLAGITDRIQTGIDASANVSVAQAPSGNAAIVDTLNLILARIPDGVYLDKKTLVGSLAPQMNVAMGRL